MCKQTIRVIVILLLLYCVFLLPAAEAREATIYDQVLEKLESLTSKGTIEVNMGVEPERYEESFKVTAETLEKLHEKNVPTDILTKLEGLKGKKFEIEEELISALEATLGKEQTTQYKSLILEQIDYQGTAVYQYGDKFETRFQVSEDSYVVLMHIAGLNKDSLGNIIDGGNITFLLPNQQFSDSRIEAGQVYSTLHHFDMDIPVGPPPGSETINLFCSNEKLDLFKADFNKEAYYTIAPDDEERLIELLDSLNQLEGREWSGSSLKLRIGQPPLEGLQRGVPRKFGALPPIGSTGTTGKFFPPIGSTGTTGKK